MYYNEQGGRLILPPSQSLTNLVGPLPCVKCCCSVQSRQFALKGPTPVGRHTLQGSSFGLAAHTNLTTSRRGTGRGD